ncbi:DUF3703 domain-containing protein [Vulgatibacter incomptus]|uniref:DUF3703 domain-containing protein n=1 Tax=Vulgatibacter incomptus TaxID=1391653 RepID=A0A0K1PDI1_9BACT|nr:DUF3703 domain-containing protein [Vulgatibacter incomptus]AKU91174.1 hypothetical protein AKJ08_1561 [Vulgatibacter incomptus]
MYIAKILGEEEATLGDTVTPEQLTQAQVVQVLCAKAAADLVACPTRKIGDAMNGKQKEAFELAIYTARARMRKACWDEAFAQLERAHVLGQRFVWPHVVSHWLMMRVELARRAPIAALGQVVRIALGAAGSAMGLVPMGNTGGSNVSMFQQMPIAPELQALMEDGGGEAAKG